MFSVSSSNSFFGIADQITSGYPIYKMVIDDGSSPENSKLVLAARKRKKAKTSSYLISTSADDLRKDSPSYVAKVPQTVVTVHQTGHATGIVQTRDILNGDN